MQVVNSRHWENSRQLTLYFMFILNSYYQILLMPAQILPKFALCSLVFLINHVFSQSCWRDGYNRFQVPQAPSQCPAGLVSGTDGFCYPKCINDYDGGKVCYQTCPVGTIPCGDVLCLSGTVCSTIPTQAVSVKTAVDAAVTAGKQFSIEEIVRTEGAGALALADKMCNSPQTFAQIDEARTASYNCNQRRFPAFLGSSSGSTKIEALELDPNGKIAIGGYSTDSSIFGAASNVFVGIYEHHGFNFTWVTTFPSSLTQSVSDLIFEPVPAGTQPTGLLVLFKTSPVTIAIIQANSGSVISTLHASSAGIGTNKGYRLFGADPVSGWISFAFQNTINGRLTLVGLNLFRAPTQSSFNGLTLSGSNIKPYSVAVSRDGLSVYVGGTAEYSIFVKDCMTLVEFSIAATPTSYSPSYIQNYYLNKKFSRSRLDIFESSIYMVAEQVSGSTETGLMIMQKVGSTYSHYNYIENNKNNLKLIDAKGISTQTVYILLINIILPKVRFLEVSFVGAGQVYIIEKILKRPDLLINELLGARLHVNREFYLFGTRTSYSSAIWVGSGSVGFFTYSADYNICGAPGTTATFQISIGTPFTRTLTGVNALSGTFTAQAQTTTMTQQSPEVALINLSRLHQLHNTECYKQLVMPTLSPISIRYIVDYPEIQFDYPGFYLYPNYCNEDFNFWFSLQDPQPPTHQGTSLSPVPVPQPTGPIFFFDWIYPKFKIWIPHPTTSAGSYNLNVIGYLPNHQVTVGPTFTIEVYSIPLSATIAPSQISDLTYVLSGQQHIMTWQAFVPSLPHYVTYYLESQHIDGSYSQDFDNGVFTFTQGQRDEKLTVYTSDISKAKIYNLRIMGKYTPRTPMFCVSYFKVKVFSSLSEADLYTGSPSNLVDTASPFVQSKPQDTPLLDLCIATKITPSFLPKEVVFEMSNSRFLQPEIIKFEDWQESVGICKPFIYKAQMADCKSLPSFIKFLPNTRKFSFQQTPEMKPGSYSVVLRGIIATNYLMNLVDFNLIVKCQVQLLKTIQPDQTLQYIVGFPTLRLQVQEFDQQPKCERPIEYEAVLSNGSPLPKAYFTFQNEINSLGIRHICLSFGTNEVPKENNYTIQIRAKAESGSDRQKKKMISTLNITIKIQETEQLFQVEYPPIYLLVKQGERMLIPFGYLGTQGGQRLLEKSNIQAALPTVEVELKRYSMQSVSSPTSENQVTLKETMQPPSQYLQEDRFLQLMPQKDTPSGTRYFIKTVMTDKNKKKFRISQNLLILVYRSESDSEFNLGEEMARMMQLLTQTQIEYDKNKFGESGNFFAIKNMYPKKAEVNGTLQLFKVYRNSRAEMKIWPSSEQLMKYITNNSFMVILSNRERIDYQILSQDEESGIIKISLSFEDTSKISQGVEVDVLEVSLIEKLVLDSANQIINFQKGLRSKRSIPPLLQERVKFIAELLKGGRINIETHLAINILISIFIQILWVQLNDISFLTANMLVSMPVPGIVQIMNQVILKFIYVDIFNTEKWFPDLFSKYQIESDRGINEFFEENGFQSIFVVMNLGSTLVFLLIQLGILGMYSVIHNFNKSIKRLSYLKEKLKKLLFYNSFLSLLHSQGPPLMMASMINMSDLSFDTSLSYDSSVLSIILLVSIAIAIALEIFVIHKHKGGYHIEEFKMTYGACISGLNNETFIGRYWNPLTLIRWAITNLIMIFLRDQCVAQIFILLVISVIFQMLLLFAEPMNQKCDQRMTLMIEVSVSIYLYALLSLTDYMGENKLRIELGWMLALLTAIVVGINVILFLWKISSRGITFIELTIPRYLGKENRTVSPQPSANNNLAGKFNLRASSNSFINYDQSQLFKLPSIDATIDSNIQQQNPQKSKSPKRTIKIQHFKEEPIQVQKFKDNQEMNY